MKPFDLNDYEPYRTADEKLSSLQLQFAELRRRENELQGQYSAEREHEVEVEAVLDGRSISTATVTRTELQQISRERRIVSDAIERQQQVVRKQQWDASKELLERAKPQYKSIINKQANILDALREVVEEERVFVRLLEEAGVLGVAEMRARFIPRGPLDQPPRDGVRHDPIAEWKREAERKGIL